MKTTVVFTALMLMGCPVAVAYEHPELPDCVIDRCENDLCTIETPEGTVEVPKKRHYEEGTPVVCPLWLIEPT
tara:strand:+ start:72 stop:290 length:219 start_codon:yes stop_codon:yes gene_type:complete